MSNEPNIAVAVVVVVVTLARCCLLDIIDPHVAHTHSVVGMLTGGGMSSDRSCPGLLAVKHNHSYLALDVCYEQKTVGLYLCTCCTHSGSGVQSCSRCIVP